jgi:hypothetical protein
MMRKKIAYYLIIIVHKFFVALNLFDLAWGLLWRAVTHDLSKFRNIEARDFAEHTPLLKTTVYGSPEYKRILERMNKALSLHYGCNRHHPEHWKYGLHEMDAVDLCEMLCDWEAASRLSHKGNLLDSVDHNQKRFHTGSIMADVFRNTALFRWGIESKRKKIIFKWTIAILTTLPLLIWWLI